LMKFEGLDGEGQEQWNKQREFMCQVLKFAAEYGVHIHLVAHSKKPDKAGEAKIPRRYDISGSAHISNLPQNVIVIWRNRGKQDRLEQKFQELEEEFISVNPGQAVPNWKRLLGGHPSEDAPAHIQEAWQRMLLFIDRHIGAEDKVKFLEEVAVHDAYFIVDAQRGGDGDCPARHLWFHYDSLQFIEASPWNQKLSKRDPRRRPVDYVKKTVLEMDEEL